MKKTTLYKSTRIEVLNRYEVSNNRWIVNVYSVYMKKKLSKKLDEEICRLLYNEAIQDCRCYSYNNLEKDEYFFIKPEAEWGLEISFLSETSDSVGKTAKQIIKDYLTSNGKIKKNTYLKVRSSKLILGKGDISEEESIELNSIDNKCRIIYKNKGKYYWEYYNRQRNIGFLLNDKNILCHSSNDINGLIYHITNKDVKKLAYPFTEVKKKYTKLVNLNLNDEELKKLSRDGINNNGSLGLSLLAMQTIKNYFNKLNRNPYDIEIESIAQTWSEHCKHNIFCFPIDKIEDGLYEYYIKRATREINSCICVSVFSDNAGGIIFDDNYLIVDKVETHNTPSALDPFGGAMTGVLGVNRDILGFGKGAMPVMNTYYFCFAETAKKKLYRDKNLKDEILPPEYIIKEVIRGVKVASNSSGIPAQLGSAYFDDRFCGKPLVFVGSVGIIPRYINSTPSHIKNVKNGDKIVIIGGRVGKDGIHGATFSSKELSESNQSSATAQFGDPIAQRKLLNAVIEARDLSLYSAITDNGAGGMSSSIGEMGKDGFKIDLSKVLLKNDNITPWEIWISESQERMTVAVPENNLSKFKKIMKKHDVEVSIIGEFNTTGMSTVEFASNIPIMNIETKFLHNGNPRIHLYTKPRKANTIKNCTTTDKKILAQNQEIELKEMLNRPNIRSKEFIIVQYDHEVQGSSVLKPLQGKGRVCSEAIVSRPILSSNRGIVRSHGFGSSYGEIDTYHMAACAIDTAIRNYVAIGGNINHLALLDNFCWCNSYNPERLWQLKRAAKACYDFATAFKTPFISGKDSMFNDFRGYDENGEEVMISIPPSLLISAIGIIENIEDAVSLDVKMPGDLIYIIGTTYDELGRSEYQLYSGVGSNKVPRVFANSAKKLYERYSLAVKDGIIASAIALNLGGAAIALAKSLIAGDLGARIDLSLVQTGRIKNSNLKNKILMFSESQSRILVTIAPKNQKRFEELFINIAFSYIGKVIEEKTLSIKNILKVNLKDLKSSYRNANIERC